MSIKEQNSAETYENAHEQNLTRYEWLGLMNAHNLADGHARQTQSPAMEGLVDRLAETYRRAEQTGQLAQQRDFEDAFYFRAGQTSMPARERRPLHHYSSSVSIEVVANYLRANDLRVGLLNPTFDNIPAILVRHNVQLDWVDESIFEEPGAPTYYEGHDALFLVIPNNPTGAEPTPHALRTIADQCRRRNMILIVDFCFRFFGEHTLSWDQYEYFDATGVKYIGIEDTGKTWPTLDLKIGSLVCAGELQQPLQRITDDLLLNVSPFVFALLHQYIEADDQLACRAVAATNRGVLERELLATQVTMAAVRSPMSVAWLGLPDGWHSDDLVRWLEGRGISVLPGSPFHWADRTQGTRNVRVALMRSVQEFAASAHALAAALASYYPSDPGDRSVASETVSLELADLVTRVCAEVLELADAPPLNADFFEVGGDSMAAMHLIGRLSQETGLELRVKMLFEDPSLAALAAKIATLQAVVVNPEWDTSDDPRSSIRAAFVGTVDQ